LDAARFQKASSLLLEAQPPRTIWQLLGRHRRVWLERNRAAATAAATAAAAPVVASAVHVTLAVVVPGVVAHTLVAARAAGAWPFLQNTPRHSRAEAAQNTG
jgi:hypothetical protein